MRQLGRKWSRKHDVDYVAYMVRNHYLPSEELDKAREEYAEERALKQEHRCEAGNPPPKPRHLRVMIPLLPYSVGASSFKMYGS